MRKLKTVIAKLTCFLIGHDEQRVSAEYVEKNRIVTRVIWPYTCKRFGYESPQYHYPPMPGVKPAKKTPDLDSIQEEFEKVTAERDQLKATLFEAQQALLKEGMRADALQARLNAGVRVWAGKSSPSSPIYCDGGGCFKDSYSNATLIIDEGVEL